MSLTREEVEEFKRMLLEMKARLQESIEGNVRDVRSPEESRGYSQHQADEGSNDFDRKMSIHLTDEELQLMKKIDHALQKIEEGTYGICDMTGKPIPKQRLSAIPYASVTVEAQEKAEQGRR